MDFDPKELAMGLEIEKEHYPDMAHRRKIATDHLKEFPDYYTRLTAMEKEAEKESPNHEKKEAASKAKPESKEKEGEEDRVDKAFKTWRSTASESLASKPVADEPYHPTISLDKEGECEHKIGDECELKFKAHVHEMSKTDKGHRVTYKLKEVAE